MSGTEIQKVESTTVARYVDPMIEHFDVVEKMANKLAQSQAFGKKTPSEITALMMIAHSRGIPLIEGPIRFHVFQGQTTMKSAVILAEFQKARGVCKWVETSDTRHAAYFSHPEFYPEPELVEFTVKEAEKAGLMGKEVWQKWRKNMLRARVITNGVGLVLPGVTMGIMSAEEAQEIEVEFRPATPDEASARTAQKLKETLKETQKKVAEPEAVIDATVTPSPTSVAPEPRKADPQPKAEWSKHVSDDAARFNGDVAALAQRFPDIAILKTEVKQEEINRALVDSYVEAKLLDTESLKTNGKKDGKKFATAMQSLWDKDAEDFKKRIGNYLAARYQEVAAALPDDADLADDEFEPGEDG
jgi:hypothetical protein